MDISVQKRQIRKLIKIIINKYSNEDVATISASEIADYLQCPNDVVENELISLCEKGVIKPVYKIYCGSCDRVMAYYATPRDFTGFVKCPHCYSQPEDASEEDLVLAYGAPYENDFAKWLA